MDPLTIYTNNAIYRFLLYYFLEDISNPYVMKEIESSPNQRWTLSQLMASWLPHEKHYPEILAELESFAHEGIREADA